MNGIERMMSIFQNAAGAAHGKKDAHGYTEHPGNTARDGEHGECLTDALEKLTAQALEIGHQGINEVHF